MANALLFLDIETLGIERGSAIWEVAAMRVEDGLMVGAFETFVHCDPTRRQSDLPTEFLQDYLTRFDAGTAITPVELFQRLGRFAEGRAVVCGSNPAFDMDRLELLAEEHGAPLPGWHYHPDDVPVLARGWLNGKGIYPAPPWRSDFISQAIGVDPRDYERHTAMGDVLWCRAMWHVIHGGR